jgi:C1A family cysteine protease
MSTLIQRAYTYKKPKVPHKTLKLHAAAPGSAIALPDLSTTLQLCGPVIDQGSLGSCTACSGIGAAMLLSNRQIRDGVWKGPTLDASVLAFYWDERSIDGTTDSDAGASIADSVQAATTAGYIPDSSWPYTEDPYATPPTVSPLAVLADHAPITQDIDTIRACLAMGYPVQFGIMVYSSFESQAVASSGAVPLPDTNTEQQLGGHALFLYGYDHPNQMFLGRNSWGPQWGDEGNFTIPYSYILDAELCWETYVLRRLAQP